MLRFNRQWCLQEVNLWRYDLCLVNLLVYLFMHCLRSCQIVCAIYPPFFSKWDSPSQIPLYPKPIVSCLYDFIFPLPLAECSLSCQVVATCKIYCHGVFAVKRKCWSKWRNHGFR
jgi:hypothetical protein